VIVAYTANDYLKKGVDLRLCKAVEVKPNQFEWVDAEDTSAFGPASFKLLQEAAHKAMGGFGIIKVASPDDPRVAWY
jgi:hypothetical protein